MPISMREWRATAVKKYEKYPMIRMSHETFFRDPPRVVWTDWSTIRAPADGIIIYQKRCQPEGDLIEAKGTHCTLRQLMDDQNFDKPCLVIATFMTFYHVHVNRMPTAGLRTHWPVATINTFDVPMLWVEEAIVQKGSIDFTDMRYTRNNGRMINKVTFPYLGYTYYIVQIADYDVSKIMPFRPEPVASFKQCERFSLVRWGSEVTLVLPLDDRFRFKTLCQVTDSVEAGNDALVEIIRR